MANEVEIHVKWQDDNSDKIFADQKAKAKKAGSDAGDQYSGSFTGKLNKAAPAKIKTDVDDRLAQAKLAELTAKKAAVVINYDADISKAEARIDSLEAKRGSTKIDVDAEIGKAKAKIEALKATKERVLIELDVDTAPAVGKIRKASEDVEKATEKVAQRTQQKFEAMKFTALSVGLPAAAAAGALAAGGSLALIPIAAGAAAAALLGSNEQVNASFVRLGDNAEAAATRAAQPMAGYLVQSIDSVNAAARRAEPSLNDLFTASGPGLVTFVDGVTNAASNALPGLIAAAHNSEGPMRGLASLLSDTGAGATDMFVNMTKGSAGAESGLKTFGGIIRDVEGFAGDLFANLANGSSAILPQFAGVLHQAEDVILTMSSSGMPLLQGATSGLLGTVSGGIGIVSAFASGLGTWAQPLGSAAGQLFATNTMAKLFGTSLGETGFGLRSLATYTDAAGQKTNLFKTAMADADKAGTSKLKAGASSLLSAGINPLGIALVAGGFILNAFGEAQQRASEQAAAHKENVRSLTDAIRADNGVLGEHTARVNTDALQQKNAAANLSTFSATLGEAKLAIDGNSIAYQALSNKGAQALRTIAEGSGATKDQVEAFAKLGDQALTTGQSYDQLTKGVGATVYAYDAEGNATDLLTESQKKNASAVINGLGTIGEQINAQKQAHQEYIEAEHALTGLTTAQIENRDATTKSTQAIYEQQNAMLGYRGAVLNTKSAIDDYEKTLKNGKATADDKAAALLKVENAFAAQEQAAYKAAFANNANKTSNDQLAAATTAMNAETVKLANSFAGQLPASVQATIGQFDYASARAAGLTVAIDDTGRAVYRLPNGKFIAIESTAAQEAARMDVLRDAINNIPTNKKSTVEIVTIYSQVGTAAVRTGINSPSVYLYGPHAASGGLITNGGVQRFAKGGQAYAMQSFAGGGSALDVSPGGLLHGPGTGTSDDILAKVSNREFVVNARQAEKHLPLLQAINAGVDGFADGGMVKYGDVSQNQWDGLYASGWRGNPNDGMEALYAPAQRQSAQPVARSGGSELRLVVDSGGGGDFERLFAELIRRYVRVYGGGNVQNAYGQR